MGIPSYYKKLCDTVPGLLEKKFIAGVENFYIDFNCLIYYCIRRIAKYDGSIEWEKNLIEEVCKYTLQIVDKVKPTGLVYIAIDGSVPAAKMRQQRLRRFKSIWMRRLEIECGNTEKRWDTNAITPGTVFMENLSKRLNVLCKAEKKRTGVKWILSDETESGEGEHKLFAKLRDSKKGSQVIYGLDADLIVLALIESCKTDDPIYLFRESIEYGEVQKNALNEEEYRYLHINRLFEHLTTKVEGNKSNWILNYAMGMSLLGNDFLPHGLTFSIKHGGHDLLLGMLSEMSATGYSLIVDEKWSKKGLAFAFRWLSGYKEDDSLKAAIESKCSRQFYGSKSKGSVEPWQMEMDKHNRLPIEWFEESCLIVSKDTSGVTLSPRWREIYMRQFLGAEDQDIDKICNEYCKGLQWILEYYLGKAVDPHWMFPWSLPPTWSHLSNFITTKPFEVFSGNPNKNAFLKPQEQLAIVLPLESYSLIRDVKLRKLPQIAPQFWCKDFGLVSVGRKMLWECEAKIPLLTPMRLRFLLEEVS
jgi:5'-3' exonuclease